MIPLMPCTVFSALDYVFSFLFQIKAASAILAYYIYLTSRPWHYPAKKNMQTKHINYLILGHYRLPSFITEAVRCVQGIRLSRESINNVLARHGINGYPREYKRWRFFRAKEPDELWQIDFKGPFTVQGRKYWFLICIDDYSRFLVLAEQFDHEPRTGEVTALLERQRRHPKAVLSDHGSQFRETWKRWCRENRVEAHYAHPSYPQDKGKVERCIQNLNREFVNHLREFPGWLKGKLREYREWFNHSRFHRGIKALPADLYECNVRNLT